MHQPVDIILVEDSPSDAALTIRVLQKRNLANNLLHFKDGAEALDYLFARGPYNGRIQIEPRVVLLDLKMPKITGIEVLRQLKSNVRTRTIPVVVLTSSREDPDVRRCYELGVNSYVVKPIDFEAFAEAVSQLGLYWLQRNETGR